MSRERLVAAAGSTGGRLGLLGAIIFAVWLASVVVATLTGSFATFGEASWSGLRHLLDPGSLGDDIGTGRRIVGVVQVIAGIVFLFGVLFTVLAELVDRGLTRLSEAAPPVRARNHLVVIGAGAETLARSMALDPAGAEVDDLVLLLPKGADDPTGAWPEGGPSVQVRFGDPREPGVLAGLSVGAARGVIVLSPEETDAKVADLGALEIGATLAAELAEEDRERPLVAIEIHRGPNVEDLWGGFPPEFDAVPQDRGVGALLALAVANPAFAGELTGIEAETARPFVVSSGELAGRPFSEAIACFSGALPVGLIRGKDVRYAPPLEYVVHADDGLIVFARTEPAARMARTRPLSGGDSVPELALEQVPVQELLVVGWTDIGYSLLAELDAGIGTTVLYEGEALLGLPEDAIRVDDLDDRETLAEALETHGADAVVVLAGTSRAEPGRHAHARVALTALHLCVAAGERRLPVIIEQHSVERARRLRLADPRIKVVSTGELTAQALVLSVLDRRRQIVTEALGADLGDGIGSGPRIETVRLGGTEAVPFAAVWRALLDRGLALLAMRRDGAGLEPDEIEAGSLRPGDELLVVKRGLTSSSLA